MQGNHFSNFQLIRENSSIKRLINVISMVSIGEIWGVNILSKFQGILYGPTALPFLSWDMISISDESVGERKNDESIFSQDIQGEFFCSGDF